MRGSSKSARGAGAGPRPSTTLYELETGFGEEGWPSEWLVYDG
jgi:hypothetical protein